MRLFVTDRFGGGAARGLERRADDLAWIGRDAQHARHNLCHVTIPSFSVRMNPNLRLA
jgi:hypothetical protein